MSFNTENMTDSQNPCEDLRIVLLGKIGVGKSSTGNTILGEDAFKCDLAPSSVTSVCKKVTGHVNGRKITVIDTPGLFDTSFTLEETIERIKLCIPYSAPGPHVFLVVVQVGRFTHEDNKTVEIFLKIFGEASSSYTMILFTHGDKLLDKSIYEFVIDNPDLTAVFRKCNKQHHVFNNTVKDSTQVAQLVEKVDSMLINNGGGHYTNEMLLMAERAIEEEKQRILMEDEQNRRREFEALKQSAMGEANTQLVQRRAMEARTRAENYNKYIDIITNILWNLLENYTKKN